MKNGYDAVMKKRKSIIIILTCILLVLIAIGTLLFIGKLPEKDTIQTDGLAQQFKIDTDCNYIDFQTGNECSAYASAYVMRHLGNQTDWSELYNDIHRIFGFVHINSVVDLFQNHGYNATAYHGDINTMKQRLIDGVPIIAFVSIPGDTHYVVITGYDESFIYLVDSISDNSNADGGWYNRKLSVEEFEMIWKTNMYPVENIYIVVSQ